MNLFIFLPFLFLCLLFSLLSFSLPLFLPFEIRDYKGLYFSFLFQEEKARRNQMCNTFFFYSTHIFHTEKYHDPGVPSNSHQIVFVVLEVEVECQPICSTGMKQNIFHLSRHFCLYIQTLL